MTHNSKIAVIGLGYVGLPVAVAFARSGVPVIGFDIDRKRVDELPPGATARSKSTPPTSNKPSLRFTHDRRSLPRQTSISSRCRRRSIGARRPDLGAILSASDTVGEVLKRGDIVVYESTVIPARSKKSACRCLKEIPGLPAGATSLSAIRRSGSIRATNSTASRRSQSRLGAGCAHAGYRRRCLWVGREGRHPSRTVDQGR